MTAAITDTVTAHTVLETHTETNTETHTENTAPAAADLTDIRTDYRWTAACQRAFLEELACSGSVTRACAHVAKSARSAYDLRFRRDGAAFALGWDAAILVARVVVAGTLMDRVIHGYEEISIKQEDGSLVRLKQDNKLGLNLLVRLDKMALSQAAMRSGHAHSQIVAQDFEAYLDLVGGGCTGAQAAQFVAAHEKDNRQYTAHGDYENACELAQIYADQEEEEAAAAAAAAYIPQRQTMLDMEPEAAAKLLDVWYDEDDKCWKTNFPAADLDEKLQDILDNWDEDTAAGSAFFGDEDYERPLTAQELTGYYAVLTAKRQPWIDAAVAARDAWFAGA
jgi:hypothetical protein